MSPASSLTAKGFTTVVDLNLNGTFNMCKAAFDGYMGENGGSIVNIVADCRNGFPRMVHTVWTRSFSMSLDIEREEGRTAPNESNRCCHDIREQLDRVSLT